MAPNTYKSICVSLYTTDLERVDRQVREAKQLGWTRANRSELIRRALEILDVKTVIRAATAARASALVGPAPVYVLGTVVLFNAETWWGRIQLEDRLVWFHAGCYVDATASSLPCVGQPVLVVLSAQANSTTVLRVAPRAHTAAPAEGTLTALLELDQLVALTDSWDSNTRPTAAALRVATYLLRGFELHGATLATAPITNGGISLVLMRDACRIAAVDVANAAPQDCVVVAIDDVPATRVQDAAIYPPGARPLRQFVELHWEDAAALLSSLCARRARDAQPASWTTEAETPAVEALPKTA